MKIKTHYIRRLIWIYTVCSGMSARVIGSDT